MCVSVCVSVLHSQRPDTFVFIPSQMFVLQRILKYFGTNHSLHKKAIMAGLRLLCLERTTVKAASCLTGIQEPDGED